MIVVDASLATKWLVAEADHETALQFLLRFRAEIAAPDLLLSEVSSAIVRRANAREMAASDAFGRIAEWLLLWRRGPFAKYRLTADLLAEATRIALQLGHPLADCLYLALAIELDCDLVTCDAKFQAKATAEYPRVKLLAAVS